MKVDAVIDQEVCRICLSSDDGLISMYQDEQEVYIFDEISIPKMINECTTQEIKHDDEFPKRICIKCVEDAKIAYNFRKQSENSHNQLVSLLNEQKKILSNDYKDVVDESDTENFIDPFFEELKMQFKMPEIQEELPPNEKCIQTEELAFYPCEKCERKFINYDQLKEHRVIEHKGTLNKCRICLKEYNRMSHLRRHIAANHPEVGFFRIKCKICHRNFTRPESLTRHEELFHSGKVKQKIKITIPVVNKVTIPIVNKVEKLYCSECSILFENENDYNEHKCKNLEQLASTNDGKKISSSATLIEPEIVMKIDKPDDLDSDHFDAFNDVDDIIDKGDDTSSDEEDMKSLAQLKSEAEEMKRKQGNSSNEVSVENPTKSFKSSSVKLKKSVNGNTCIVCNKTFSRPSDVRRHMLTHTDEKPHACDLCDRRFNRIDHLRNHKMHRHESNVCDICKENFTKASQLRKHKESCHAESNQTATENSNDIKNDSTSIVVVKTEIEEDSTENQLKPIKISVKDFAKKSSKDTHCDTCNKTFTRPRDLRRHMLIHTGEKPYSCDVCEKRFSRPDHLKLHKFNHAIDKLFSCDICNKDFIRKDLLQKHKNSCHGENNFEGDDKDNKTEEQTKEQNDSSADPNKAQKKTVKGTRKRLPKETHCHTCNKTFSRPTHLRRHMSMHSGIKPYGCDKCDKCFARPDQLNLHKLYHAEVKPYICDVCNKGFIRAEHLRKHKDACHGTRIRNPKTEFCEICNRYFSSAKYLRIHKKAHTENRWSCKHCEEVFELKSKYTEHMKTHANERPFLCSECGVRFVRNSYLVIHMRRHTGYKPFTCKYCGKGFPRTSDLQDHERYHTGEKKHLCPTCGKGFQRKYHLRIHTRIHTGERPYKCPHCSKSFTQGNDLKAHIRRHTGERFKCDICGDGFIQGYHLTQHKRKVHGLEIQSNIGRVKKFLTPIEQQQQVEALKNQMNKDNSNSNIKYDTDGGNDFTVSTESSMMMTSTISDSKTKLPTTIKTLPSTYSEKSAEISPSTTASASTIPNAFAYIFRSLYENNDRNIIDDNRIKTENNQLN